LPSCFLFARSVFDCTNFAAVHSCAHETMCFSALHGVKPPVVWVVWDVPDWDGEYGTLCVSFLYSVHCRLVVTGWSVVMVRRSVGPQNTDDWQWEGSHPASLPAWKEVTRTYSVESAPVFACTSSFCLYGRSITSRDQAGKVSRSRQPRPGCTHEFYACGLSSASLIGTKPASWQMHLYILPTFHAGRVVGAAAHE
jgi:hypothetical protein